MIDDNVIDPQKWYMDRDEDGLGDPGLATLDCEQPEGHVSNADDCDDLSKESCEKGGTCNTLNLWHTTWWILCVPTLCLRRRSTF